ncbi:smoothelin-like protein 1 [Ctenodactylus gundi]
MADGSEGQESALHGGGTSAQSPGEASGSGEAAEEAEKEDHGVEETTATSPETVDREGETPPEPQEAEGRGEATLASEKLSAAEREAEQSSGDKGDTSDRAGLQPTVAAPRAEAAAPKEAEQGVSETAGEGEPPAEPPPAPGNVEAESDSRESVSQAENVSGPSRTAREPFIARYTSPPCLTSSGGLTLEAGGPSEEQENGEAEAGAAVTPSSPEPWPESPTEEGGSLSPDGPAPEPASPGETSPSAREPSASDPPQGPTEPAPGSQKRKEPAPVRRVSAPARPRGPRAQNRKAIVDKFGGAASGPTALFRNTKAAGAAIGGVKSMLLEWCRAMTRKYEHVDIQNFSSSWSSGMAFCALIHRFFPDAFDYAALDPAERRHNFALAFATAETMADCAQLLDVDDMVRLAVPDSKCVYTYIQELYRSLVQKGLVKTKK